MNPLKTSVLLVNYNYGCYIKDAITSILRQDTQVDEIVIVDDGSTDDSHAVIEATIAGHPNVNFICKENGGQLSAYQAAFKYLSGDIIFFLDSDDQWQENHVTKLLHDLNVNPEIDFIYGGHHTIGNSQEPWNAYPHPQHLGISSISQAMGQTFHGTTPSATAIKKTLLNKFFPILDPDLCHRGVTADEYFVKAASIFGGIKYFSYPPTVLYRIHGKNDSLRKLSKSTKYRQLQRSNYLLDHLVETAKLSKRDYLRYHKEFETIPRPTKSDYKIAIKTAWRLPIPLRGFIKVRMRLWQHYHKSGS